jgi:hypothetical protein
MGLAGQRMRTSVSANFRPLAARAYPTWIRSSGPTSRSSTTSRGTALQTDVDRPLDPDPVPDPVPEWPSRDRDRERDRERPGPHLTRCDSRSPFRPRKNIRHSSIRDSQAIGPRSFLILPLAIVVRASRPQGAGEGWISRASQTCQRTPSYRSTAESTAQPLRAPLGRRNNRKTYPGGWKVKLDQPINRVLPVNRRRVSALCERFGE